MVRGFGTRQNRNLDRGRIGPKLRQDRNLDRDRNRTKPEPRQE